MTSADFLNTMTRALDPKSGSGYANYLFPIRNAEAIYNGEMESGELGVETPDDYTLIFYLEKPCVYFLDLLRLPVYTPSCSTYAKETGSGWDTDPKTSVSNGPFYLAEYVPEQYMTLKKNESYWNADAVSLDEITYRFFDSQEAMLYAYESGEADAATGLPSTVMSLYEGKEDLEITETIATRYIYPNLNVEPLQDVRVRKAISLALNREDLCQAVVGDTEPTVNFIAAYMKDKTTGNYFIQEAESPFQENVKEAQKLLAEAGYPNGEGFPVLTYNYPTLEMDSDTAQVLQEQLKKNLNIEIKLNAQELQVNYSERRAGNFDLCRMNWTADFADPYTYLSMLLSNSTYNCSGIQDAQYDALVAASDTETDPGMNWTADFADPYTYLSMLLSNSTYNCSGIQDAQYDALVAASDTETDPAKRAELMHQAERLAVGEQFYVIPLYSMKSCNLIRPKLEGITQIAATGALEYRYAKWAD